MRRLLLLAILIATTQLLGACGSTVLHTTAAVAKDHAPVETADPYQQNRRSVSTDVRQRFERANLAMAEQDWSTAMVELQWLADTQPDLSGPRLNLALTYQNMGDLEKAEQLYRQALEINRNNLAAYNQYAIFLREQGRFAEAEQIYLQALDTWEPHALTHRNIGVLYDMYMGDRERALHHFYRYQALAKTEDRVVANWIADLNRQLMTLAQGI